MKYGVLFCSFNGNTGYQLYIPNSTDNYIYIRTYYSDSFRAWQQIPIGALAYLSSYTSLADLASALGVLPQKGNLSANDNWDTLSAGIYASNGNVPSGSGLYGWGTLIVFGQDSPSLFGVAQLYFPNSNNGTFSWRTKYTYAGSFTSWQTLPSFLLSYSDLPSLASALGVGYFFGSIPQNRYIPVDGDCMNINEGGLWQITGSATPGAGPEHSPSKGKYFYVFAFGTEGVSMLLAVQTRMESAYIGVKRDNDIIWKPIMFTT